MGTKMYALSGAVPYNNLKSCDVDRTHKDAFSKRELGTVRRILKDFGYKEEQLMVPPEIKTSGQLQAWKKRMIDEKLAG